MRKSSQWKSERHASRVQRKSAKVRSQQRSGKGKRSGSVLTMTPQASSFLAMLVAKALTLRDEHSAKIIPMPPTPRRIAREARKAA